MDFISPIINIGSQLIDAIFPDQEKARDAKFKLQNLKQTGKIKLLEARMKAIVMEAQSQDPWTSRARPSFLYVMYIMILMAIPIGFMSIYDPAMVQIVEIGLKGWLNAIPQPMWALFGAGYLGYSHFRSKDKKLIVDEEKQQNNKDIVLALESEIMNLKKEIKEINKKGKDDER